MRGNPSLYPQTPTSPWMAWALRLILVLWVLQLAWLAWHLRQEPADLGQRLWGQTWGEAVRRDDPFYRWLVDVQPRLPPEAVYVFLDNYEAGKEIEARYHLFPRQHLLILPASPPSLVFHTLKEHQASFILRREAQGPPGLGLKALLDLGAAQPLNLPGKGQVLRLNPQLITGGFYD